MKKYFGEIEYIGDYSFRRKFVVTEQQKKWFNFIVKKYFCSEVEIVGANIDMEHIERSVEWKEISDEEYEVLSKQLENNIPFKEYFEDEGMYISSEDEEKIKTWIAVDGKILKLEESTQEDLLDLLIKLDFKLDVGLDHGFIEAYEFEKNLMDDNIKSLELSDNTAYLSTNEAEEYNDLDNIITYEYIKNKYEENKI